MENKTTVRDICKILETFAPLDWQEPYDNCGLLIGNLNQTIKKVLLCIDVTEEVLSEAKELECNMIISHHPLIFNGIKKITGKTYVERCIAEAIKNDIAIYAAHTNFDNAKNGVSFRMAEKIGLKNCRILSLKKDFLIKLVTFIPEQHAEKLRSALFKSGAGHIGEYDCCSYNLQGEGTFRGSDYSRPYVGERNKLHTEIETRIEVILPKNKQAEVLESLIENHPYEEPAFDLIPLLNPWGNVGAGIIGELANDEEEVFFLKRIKEVFQIQCIKHSDFKGRKIKRVALCGGSGSEFIKDALIQKADVYLTADLKYHDYFIPENKLLLADIGHFESEQYIKEIFFEQLTKKIPNFAIHFSKNKTNKINYL